MQTHTVVISSISFKIANKKSKNEQYQRHNMDQKKSRSKKAEFKYAPQSKNANGKIQRWPNFKKLLSVYRKGSNSLITII